MNVEMHYVNERIKELAEQAGFGVRQNGSEVYTSKLEHLPITENVEKFAELIVTKCAVIATRCESNGNKNIGAEILKHFGVEE